MNSKVVCLTTFRQGSPENIVEKVRAEIFIDLAKNLADLNIPCVTVFTETQKELIDFFDKLGVILINQKSTGMGSIRREVMDAALLLFPDAEFYCWLEPEKPGLSKFILPIVELMSKSKSELGLFNRIEMSSYPEEQAYYYLFCRVTASRLLKYDIDYAFGPMVMSKVAMKYFLDYSGEYGDLWDAILIPRLRIIKDEIKIFILPVDFENDYRMTVVESGNKIMTLKRIDQFNNVVPSLIKEWDRLNS